MPTTTVLVPQKSAGAGNAPVTGDKATFGWNVDLVAGNDLLNHYICRRAGSFVDCVVNLKTAPVGQAAILDLELSTDDGATWNSIFPAGNANKITLPAGSLATVKVETFAAAPNNAIDAGHLLRFNCVQAGSTIPGKQIEAVLRWE